MKTNKLIPLIAVLALVLGVVGFFLLRNGGNVSVTLTPSDDGHWLKLDVSGISQNADKMEYELIYNLPDGRVQGVPGSIELEGESKVERDILLGTESSGNYYYDEGVESGTLTLRLFKNDDLFQENTKDWILEDLKNNPRVF
ncbi:hypothetical protein JXA63_04895 [Candidatus Woesebacteria bacterium]|nr:hypothetical protein [Candidatus Woesebacteria bacterium]